MFADRFLPAQFGNVPLWFNEHTSSMYNTIMSTPPPPIGVQIVFWAMVATAFGGACFHIGRYTASSLRRTRTMRKEQAIAEKAMIGDALVDVIEELVHKQKISRARANAWYDKLGHHLTIPDVLPQQIKNLKSRLKHKHGERKTKTADNVVPLKPKKVGEFLKKKPA